MEEKDHPTFEREFRKLFFSSFLMCLFGAGGSIYFLRHNHETIPAFIFSSLIILGFVGFAYLLYKFNNVRCCTCNRNTKTAKSLTQPKWVAVCDHCNIEWDLKIGVGSD